MVRRLVVLAAAAALVASVATATGSAAPVRWGDRTFLGPTRLAEWLAARGADYDTWARRHPDAAALLEGRLPPAPAPSRRREERRVRSTPPARTSEHETAASTSSFPLDSALAAVSVLLLALSVVPLPAAGALAVLRGRRSELLMAAVAVGLGAVVGRLL